MSTSKSNSSKYIVRVAIEHFQYKDHFSFCNRGLIESNTILLLLVVVIVLVLALLLLLLLLCLLRLLLSNNNNNNNNARVRVFFFRLKAKIGVFLSNLKNPKFHTFKKILERGAFSGSV